MKKRYWLIAIALAGALHLGAAAAIFWPRNNSGVSGADTGAGGAGGLEIALGPAGGAPDADDAVAENENGEDAAEYPPTTAETDEAPPSQEAARDPVPAFVEAPNIEAPAEKTVRLTPPTDPAMPARPEEVQNEAAVAAPDGEGLAEGPPAFVKAGGGGAPARDGGYGPAGGDPRVEADYAAVLLAWLERHKEYPRPARRRGQEGVVLLYVLIDREGRVLQSRIEESSGYPLLDNAVLDMLERAAPVPPLPDDMPQERLELVLPVQFFMT